MALPIKTGGEVLGVPTSVGKHRRGRPGKAGVDYQGKLGGGYMDAVAGVINIYAARPTSSIRLVWQLIWPVEVLRLCTSNKSP